MFCSGPQTRLYTIHISRVYNYLSNPKPLSFGFHPSRKQTCYLQMVDSILYQLASSQLLCPMEILWCTYTIQCCKNNTSQRYFVWVLNSSLVLWSNWAKEGFLASRTGQYLKKNILNTLDNQANITYRAVPISKPFPKFRVNFCIGRRWTSFIRTLWTGKNDAAYLHTTYLAYTPSQ